MGSVGKNRSGTAMRAAHNSLGKNGAACLTTVRLDNTAAPPCFSLMKLLSLLFLTALAATGMAETTVAAPLELITAKEAAQPNLSIPKGGKSANGEIILGRPPVPGAPQIIVEKPEQGLGVNTPFPVKIRFVPTGGAKINVNSLEIDVLKLIKISLLSRVKPYATANGINVPEAQVPSGTYNIRIAVADDQGRRGETTQTWTVL
jgi:hypothetical protein